MKHNDMYMNFHRMVRVVYRYFRKTKGIEYTQEECLKLFKIVFPELYQASKSDADAIIMSELSVRRMATLFESWNADGALKLLCEYTLSSVSKSMPKEAFCRFCNDILPVVMRIRKLTPRECGRLQGCDEETIDIIENSGVSRSAMYKLYGNSITVDVMVYVFDKLFIHNNSENRVAKQLTLF